jgi:hypothetical protein
MNTQELITSFESGSLPKKSWTHDAHLKVALWYISQESDLWSAVCLIKAGIISRNRSVGIPNTGSSGYHETVTMFWAEEINNFYQRHKHLTFEEIYDLLLQTPKFTDKHYIKQFYSNDVLKTSEARAIYVRAKRIQKN